MEAGHQILRVSNRGVPIACALLCFGVGSGLADTTISSSDKHAWGAALGWINFRPDKPFAADGAVIGETYCRGLTWSASCGWLNLGKGSPADGVHYANDDAADFGLNHDGKGGLSGLAWGAAIGWVNFGMGYSDEVPKPRIDLLTGAMSGYAWSASSGWIDLGENGEHFVATEYLRTIDSDGDSIDDGWERARLAAAGLPDDLALLGSSLGADADADGRSDLVEYRADSDPFDPLDWLRVLDWELKEDGASAVMRWSSSGRRLYQLQRSEDLQLWVDEGELTPGAQEGDFTEIEIPVGPSEKPSDHTRIRAELPLQP